MSYKNKKIALLIVTLSLLTLFAGYWMGGRQELLHSSNAQTEVLPQFINKSSRHDSPNASTETIPPVTTGVNISPEQSLMEEVRRSQKTFDDWSVRPSADVVAEVSRLASPPFNKQEFNILVEALISSLKYHGSKETRTAVQRIGELINISATTSTLRGALIHVLSKAATQEAAAKLIELATSGVKPADGVSVETTILSRIAALGAEWKSRGGQEDLTPILLTAAVSQDSPLPVRSAAALALGDIGTSQATEWLVSQLFKDNPTLQFLETTDDPMVDALLEGLRRLSSEQAVVALTPHFVGYDESNPKLHVLGPVLAGASQGKGTAVILNWASQAPSTFAPSVLAWLSKVRGTKSVQLIQQSASTREFSSPEVKQAVLEARDKLTPKSR